SGATTRPNAPGCGSARWRRPPATRWRGTARWTISGERPPAAGSTRRRSRTSSAPGRAAATRAEPARESRAARRPAGDRRLRSRSAPQALHHLPEEHRVALGHLAVAVEVRPRVPRPEEFGERRALRRRDDAVPVRVVEIDERRLPPLAGPVPLQGRLLVDVELPVAVGVVQRQDLLLAAQPAVAPLVAGLLPGGPPLLAAQLAVPV